MPDKPKTKEVPPIRIDIHQRIDLRLTQIGIVLAAVTKRLNEMVVR